MKESRAFASRDANHAKPSDVGQRETLAVVRIEGFNFEGHVFCLEEKLQKLPPPFGRTPFEAQSFSVVPLR